MSNNTVDDYQKKDLLTLRRAADSVVTNVIAPNGFQVGLSDERFQNDLTVYGVIYGAKDIRGSITKLVDGTSYIIAGDNITVTSGSTGAITISGTALDIASKTQVAADAADHVLIYDATDGVIKKATVQSIQNVATSIDINGLSALTESTIHQDDLFVVYDSSAATNKKIDLEDIIEFITTDPSTTYGSTGLKEVDGRLYVHINTLDEAGIDPAADYIAFSDEGATSDPTKKESVADFVQAIRGTTTTTGLASTNGVLNIDITNQGSLTLASADEFLVWDADASALKKTTATAIGNFVSVDLNSLSGATIDPANDSVVFIDRDDSYNSKKQTLSSFISAISGDGLNTTNGVISVDVSDFAGTGLVDDGSENLKLDLNALTAGTVNVANDSIVFVDADDSNNSKKESIADFVSGIAGSGFTASSGQISITYGATSTSAARGDKSITIDPQRGLQTGGTVVVGTGGTITLNLDADDASGVGLSSDNQNRISLNTEALTGLLITTGSSDQIIFGVDNTVISTLTGSVFSGEIGASGSISSTVQVSAPVITSPSFSGSLTKLQDGTSYLRAGNNIAITTASNGSVTVTGVLPEIGNGDGSAQYLVLAATGSLSAERVLTAGTGITTSDGGAGNNYTIGVNNSVVATLTGSTFTGPVVASNLSGSLTKLSDGSSYIVAGDNISVTTGSSGAITIAASVAGGGGLGTITGVTAGTGLSGGGNSGAVTLNVDIDSLTGIDSIAHGDMIAVADVDDSNAVKKMSVSNLSAFQAGWSNSSGYGIASFNGRLYLKPNDLGTAAAVDPAADVLIIEDADDSSTVAKKTGVSDLIAAVKGTGLKATNGVLSADDSIVATLTGSTFTGIVKAPALSGSLTHLSNGSSYLIAGDNVTITTGSSGAVTIASTAAGSTIGSAEDGTYADGLFTDFSTNTAIGVAVDRFNEVLKALAPTPAPDLDDIDCDTSAGITAFLSFGSSNNQSSASPAYTSVSTTAGFPAIDVNGQYTAATSGNNIKKGIYNGSQVISGDLNEDVAQNNNGGETNFVANSFGNAEIGTLKLEVNGSVVHSFELTGSGIGTGVPGSGTKSQLNANSSGFINLSQTGSAVLSNGDPFPSFQHRTGKYQIGTGDQRNGWNYARVIHTIGDSNKTTNYIEWVNDADSNAISAAGNKFSETGLSGSIFISGIEYNTSASAIYNVRVSNAYKYIYDTSNITFSVTNGAIPAQSKPTIGGSEDHTKVLHLTGNLSTSTDEMLSASISAAVNVSHPFSAKNLSAGGSTTASGFLIFNVTNSSTDLSETFTMEDKRLVSASYNAMSDVSGGSKVWNNVLHLSGAANQSDGLVFYNHRLYSPINTLNSGDFRRGSQGGPLDNGPLNNPNYSGLNSGTKTFFRAFKNTTGATVRDFDLTFNGSGTTIVDTATALDAGKIRVLAKIPGKTDWVDCARPFVYQSSSYGNGAYHTLDSTISGNSVNVITFGTGSINNNEYVVFAIEALAGWTGYLNTMTVNFPAAGAISAAPTLDDIDCDDTGVAANLSFGTSRSITDYTNHDTTAGFAKKDINGLYEVEASSNNLKRGIFEGSTVIEGDLNEDVSGGTSYGANTFNNANSGSLKLEVNGSVIHTVDLYNYTLSGNSLNADGSGFTNLSVPANPTDSSGVKDYRYWHRTGKYKVAAASQRKGWNYVKVTHTHGGSSTTTNFVEWINDQSGSVNDISTSNAKYSTFGSTNTYYQSGVKYFISPTGSLMFTVDNCYRNVYSDSSSAIAINNLNNFSVSQINVNGTGIVNNSAGAASMPMPLLDSSVANPQNLPIHVTASVTFTAASSIPSSSIAGGTQRNGRAACTIQHPLKDNGSLSNQLKKHFLVFSGSNSSNLNTEEYFVQEQFRVQSGSYTSQASSYATMWDSSISMNDNGGNASYATGLLVYNSKLISPLKGPVAGDFRDSSEGGDLTAPLGNPNYSSLTNATRHYKRHFKNNTSTDVPQVTITIRGDATIVGRTGANVGTLGANKNIFVEAKIPGKTGWMDCARPSAGSGNTGNGDGSLSGDLDATVDSGGATNICTFNGATVDGTASTPEYIIISIVAHKDWTGYLSRISVSYS